MDTRISTPTATVFFLLIFCAAGIAEAQEVPLLRPIPVEGIHRYDPAISQPQDVLGYIIGAQHTRPHLIVEYFERVASESDRVAVEDHGRTYEGRRLVHAIVTSPANHARLEEIRRANLRLSQDPAAVADGELQNMPSVVWMGYGVHGNEASSFEAAMLVLYHLAAGEGSAVDDVLRDNVILLIPSLNPDGHARHVNWVNGNRGRVPVSDPQNREHNEPWPGGRTNHYWFDLNRDWFPVQHPESKGRIALYRHWRPQLVTDFHEMGSDATYFFQPGIPSRYNPHIPQQSRMLLDRVGEYHADALDAIGTLYYTQESFDDFYVGKGSTYPMVTGAIGILFEQASSRALERETAHGVMDFAHTIRNQFTTSLSTLRATTEMRRDLLANQRGFYRNAPARRGNVAGHVISLGEDRTRAQHLAQIYLQHGIRVYELDREVSAGGESFRPGEAYVIPTDQPESTLISATMERMTEFEDSLFYDVSTWTMPLAFGLRHAELGSFNRNILGPEIASAELDGGELIGGRASYAYVLEWDRYYAPRALHRIQSAGIRAQVAMRPLEIVSAGRRRTLGRGAVLIPVAQFDVEEHVVHDAVAEAVTADHVRVHAMHRGLAPAGVDPGTRASPDLGSPTIRAIEKPRVALLAGSGTTAGEVGEAWHLLNERFGIPVSLIDVDAVSRIDLNRYNTIIMVQGGYGALGSNGASRLQEWVQRGGRLIAQRGGARWVVDQKWIGAELKETSRDSIDVPYADLSALRGAQRIGGSIFEVAVDNTHPVAFGFGTRVPVFRNHETFYAVPSQPGVTVARYTEDPLLSGYISEQRLGDMAGSAAILAYRLGRGRVVLLADNPNFRAFWFGTNRFFLNAIFFGEVF